MNRIIFIKICTTWRPKAEPLVDLKSCPSAGDPDCSGVAVDPGQRMMRSRGWLCSNRFISATTLRYVICAVSTNHWRLPVFSPNQWCPPVGRPSTCRTRTAAFTSRQKRLVVRIGCSAASLASLISVPAPQSPWPLGLRSDFLLTCDLLCCLGFL